MAIAKLQLQLLRSFQRRAIANTSDVQRLGEASVHAGNQILHQGTRQPPHGACPFRVVARRNLNTSVAHFHRHVIDQRQRKLAFGAFHGHLLAFHRGRHTLR
jgi:hypothetical protein